MPSSLVIAIVLMEKMRHLDLLMNLTSPHVKKVTHVIEKSVGANSSSVFAFDKHYK